MRYHKVMRLVMKSHKVSCEIPQSGETSDEEPQG